MGSNKKPANELPKSTPTIDFSKSLDTSNLKGQSVLITGGANGIGASFVKVLAEVGAYVTAVDIDDGPGQELANQLQAQGLRVQYVKADVRSFDEQKAAFDSALAFSKNSSIDIVIPCAGINGNSILNWVNESSDNPQDPNCDLVAPKTTVLDINLTGTFYTTHLALHYFRKTASATDPTVLSKQLVLVASLAGYVDLPHTSDYSAAKFGVRGLWRSIRGSPKVLGESGLRFRTNLLAPSFVLTNMTADVAPALTKIGIKMGSVEDCIDALLRIVCDEEVDSRAVAVAPNRASFDIGDDWDGLDGGKALKERGTDDTFGTGWIQLSTVNSKRKTNKDIL